MVADGTSIEMLAASHDDRRSRGSRTRGAAIGFRVASADRSFWFPGDTGLRDDFADVGSVDLALVPVGGWGPTLGEGHLDPVQAAEAVSRVGAVVAVPVHWGTFWPHGLAAVRPALHSHLFTTPGPRFAEALAVAAPAVVPLLPAHCERVALD